MKTYTLLFLFFSFIIASGAEKKTKTTIEEVTVYLEGAQIKRIASVNLTSGINEITLSDLSPNIEENSIQISGLKNTSILAINFAINYLEKKKDSEELASLKKQLKSILQQKNNFNNNVSGLQQEQKLLNNNQRIGSDETPISLEKVKEISAYYRERSTAIENEIYSLTQKVNDLNNQIKNLKNEINKLEGHTKEERGEIKLKLDSPIASNLILEIRYNVANAGWFPLYDIKSNSTESPLNITYKANVYQQTGTDWKNANIILSTGDPNTNNLKPDLNPKYLNFTYRGYRKDNTVNKYSYKYNPTIRRVSGIITDEQGMPLPGANVVEKGTTNGIQTGFDGRYTINIQGGRELFFSYLGFNNKTIPIHSSSIDVKLDESLESLEEVVVTSKLRGKIRGLSSTERKEEKKEYNQIVETKESGITSTRFKIKKKYTINSNADITVIAIDKFDMKADYQYYTAPELNENVFLTAKLGNWEQFNLLAGEANIYFEGSFAGKTNIDPLATTDSLTISLGVDPNIVVKRELLDNFKSKSFTGNNRIINRGYKISIKNNKQNKIFITLEDRMPVSQNKEIKLDNINSGNAKYDTKTGIMTWKLDISSNQKVEKQFSYQVKYPKNKQITL
ncbi:MULTISPECIES: mucoidy inhibitor MuiA family protein [Aquimarina]|uniref:mucoidy inhibitor MuiA family protein n=1 Tax=Aquimarina TaxID=290174 RepID=UPI0009442B02|nr:MULTISPECIES: mucoidy inhibitor MuiA family protein [Aquimarina]